MRRFAYERPESLADASALLREAGEGGRILAGGTDLVVGLRDGSIRPSAVIDVKHVAELSPRVERKAGHLTFGALAVMTTIETHPDVLTAMPSLAEAARVVGSVQIRNRATLAGNLCNASPAADTAPPLLVLGAVVVVSGPDGDRRVPLEDFIVGAGRTVLAPGELVREVEVPLPERGSGDAYTRLVRRLGTDLASVTLGVGVDARGVVRIAYGSVGPRPFLALDESGALADRAASPEARDTLLDGLLSQATPSATSIRAGPDYRIAMLRVLARRALETALTRRERSGA